MRSSPISRSTGRAPEPGRSRGSIDVYLFPAIVGGGLGDIEEVLAAGRHLARAGFGLTVYRPRDRPWPAGAAGPWDWPPHREVGRLRPTAPAALTVSPAWGVSAAPAEAGAFGRPGPWAQEAAEIERAYGAGATLHVSLEEFARTLTSQRENVERFREGGVRGRELRARVTASERRGEASVYRAAYRRFRAFDRPNVLSVFAGFRYDRGFAHEYPEAVETGPLWSARARGPPSRPQAPRRWVWYASPASAESIAPEVAEGLRRSGAVSLLVRAPRTWRSLPSAPGVTLLRAPQRPGAWHREFARASMRIVTGSRTLLEALELGGPFLYFNGVLGAGAQRRRHRPEKIVELLRLAREAGWPHDLLADLADFARGRRVREVVGRAAGSEGGWQEFPPAPAPRGYAPGFEDAGEVIVRAARELADGAPADRVVGGLRRASHR